MDVEGGALLDFAEDVAFLELLEEAAFVVAAFVVTAAAVVGAAVVFLEEEAGVPAGAAVDLTLQRWELTELVSARFLLARAS